MNSSRKLWKLEGILQHHSCRCYGPNRICFSCSGDVGRRTVNRFVKSHRTADTRGWQHSKASGENSAFVAQDVSKQIIRHDDVELFWAQDKLHGAVVDIEIVQEDIWKFLRDLRNGLTPEYRRLEHIGLVHRG